MHCYERRLGTARALPTWQIPPIQPNLLLVKNISVSGVFWGAHLLHEPSVLLDSVRTTTVLLLIIIIMTCTRTHRARHAQCIRTI